MKRLGVILNSVLFLSGTLLGIPTYIGEKGLKNVLIASPEHAGKFNYTVGFKGAWITSSDSIGPLQWYNRTTGQWDTTNLEYGTKGKCGIGDFTFGIGFSFTDYLSLNVYSTYLIDVMETTIQREGSGAVSYGLGDTYLGMKITPTKFIPLFSAEFARTFEFGIYPMIGFATGEERGDLERRCAHDTIVGEPCRKQEGGIHRFYTAGGMTSGAKALLTLNIQTEPKLPIHLNFGYMKYPHPNICSKMSYGVGIECIYPSFAPFVEFYGEKRVRKDYNDGGPYLSPGLRFATAKDVWVSFVIDFRLSNEPPDINNKEYHIQGGFGSAPPWGASLIISQGYDFRPPPPVGKAIVSGRVIDEDGNPVRAVVFFSDTSVMTDAQGTYKIELPPGKVVAYALPADKNAYHPSEEITKLLIGGEKEIINFRVKSKPKIVEEKPKPAILIVRVTDKVTNAPISANISFPESQIQSASTDAQGIYKTEVTPGTYVVKVEKEGYVPQTHPIVCKEGATSTLEIVLSPSPRGTTIAGKVIDYSSRKGISATISFPGTNIPSIRTDPETGTYKAEIPDGTHQIKIEAAGYVPEGQVIVCKPGETLMKDFELFKKEERIVLRGINFEFNSAVILPTSYPVLDEAAELLRKHPEIKVEIGGHTCTIGSYEYNLKLSRLRAESVRTYLIQRGIEPDRLQTRGYGPSMPIADNSTEAGRALNRRIEFRILSQ